MNVLRIPLWWSSLIAWYSLVFWLFFKANRTLWRVLLQKNSMAHFLYLSRQHDLRIIMIWIVGFATLMSSMPEFSILTPLMAPTLFFFLISCDLFFLTLPFTLLKLESISARWFQQILPVTCKSLKLFNISHIFNNYC